jgi:hypothetical protein
LELVTDTTWKFDKAIFDPLLLSPPSQMLLEPIAKHTRLLLTKRMFDIFFRQDKIILEKALSIHY